MRRRATTPDSGPVVIDGFTDLVPIGAGGFSVVYRAFEAALERHVAVKVLNASFTSDRERRDFERECKALGQLNHPDVVTVYRPAITADGRACIVMALYERNFRDQLGEGGPLSPVELLDVGIRMAVALHVAHQRGVLHRDVKPHNIFRSAYGDPALGDFGISTLADERSHDRSTALSIAYVAPEILEDGPPTAQADVYSLGATLHHLATGHVPFESRDLSAAVKRILHDDPPALGRADLPASFERAMRMAMAKDPAQRPADARAFAEVLREVQARAGHSPTALKLDAERPRDPRPMRGERAEGSPSPVAPVVELRAPDGGDSSGAGIRPPAPLAPASVGPAEATILRRPPPADAGPDALPVGPHRARRWLAPVLAVVALAAVGIGIAVSRGDSSGVGPTPTTSTPESRPPDTFFQPLAVPVGVTVTAVGDGSFRIAVPNEQDAAAFEVQRAGDATDVVSVLAADLPLTLDGKGATTLCVIVRAVGSGGRLSRDGATVCSS
ncbi:MAG: protein kinase [Ilumatobacteraceae bacterium]